MAAKDLDHFALQQTPTFTTPYADQDHMELPWTTVVTQHMTGWSKSKQTDGHKSKQVTRDTFLFPSIDGRLPEAGG